MLGWAKAVIWVPCCISFSVSKKDLGNGVGNSIQTQKQGIGRSHINLLNMKQKKSQLPSTTKIFIFSFEKEKVGVKSIKAWKADFYSSAEDVDLLNQETRRESLYLRRNHRNFVSEVLASCWHSL